VNAVSLAKPPTLGRIHQRRLRDVWRSAGWPCQDLVEVELLAAGLLERVSDAQGRETLRVTDQGVQVLAQTLNRHRKARDAHEDLVQQVAQAMQRAGRLVWRGLSLRAPVASQSGAAQWVMAMPDVFSIRHTTVDAYVEPIVHEIKVRRADLQADLRLQRKREAYIALSSQCWYVLKAGIAQPEEVPAACGVMLAHEGSLEVARPAPKRAMTLGLGTWMALARATAEPPADAGEQALL
jgi:hypothetical protein